MKDRSRFILALLKIKRNSLFQTSLDKVEKIALKLELKAVDKELLDAMYKRYIERWQQREHPLYGEDREEPFSEDDWQDIEKNTGKKIIRNKVK